MKSAVVVSAPGKVLLAGGYLVLDRKYTGLVFGLSARIHVLIQPYPTGTSPPWSGVRVRSPQFENAQWEYCCNQFDGLDGVTVYPNPRETFGNRNIFVENALRFSLVYLSTKMNLTLEPILVTVLADSDYYSRPSRSEDADDAPEPAATGRFQRYGVRLENAHKTGIGSSAALVTAFTAAVLQYHSPQTPFDFFNDDGRTRLHYLAQAIHAVAQDKVGSGFDVAAAVYGSCLYRRYSPSVLDEVMSSLIDWDASTRIQTVVDESDDDWNASIDKDAAKLPRGLKLVLCEVHGGTQSVGMAKSVLAWRAKVPEDADIIWRKLQENNDKLAMLLRSVAELASTKAEEYDKDLAAIITSSADDLPQTTWDGRFHDLRETLLNIRTYLRRMGRRVGIPIEPPPQTELLDACSALQGVLGGVVPGAGGYDAIALLVVDDARVTDRLHALCADWKGSAEEEGDRSISQVQILGLREDNDGVRVEDVEAYREWLL